MPSKPTGRPTGRPKTKEYEMITARVPRDLARVVKQYAARHRQSLSELIRDGLVWRIEQDTPGRPWSTSIGYPIDPHDLPSTPENACPVPRYGGDTGLQELSPMLHAAIAAAVRETLENVQSRPVHTGVTMPHGEQRSKRARKKAHSAQSTQRA